MAIQNPNPWGQVNAGPPPSIPARDLRPRRVWYLVAALLALVLLGAGIALIVGTVKNAVDSVDTGGSFSSGDSRTFHLVKGKTKSIYVSQSGAGHVECRIPELPSGALTQPGSSFRVTLGSRTWERVFEVKPTSTGDYNVTCTSEQPAEFALGGKPQVGSTVGGIVGAIACFFAAFFAPVTIVVITAVRRHRHRSRLTTPWPPAPQWGAPAGPAPWPPSGPVS